MTDQELYEKVRLYGRNTLLWRQKFIGLLPEVERRRLYEKKNFGSIFEFAFKLAGLTEQQVRTALNLGRRFSDKPTLKSLLENGEVSINKLVRIQSIATVENEGELAEAVKILPKSAVETLVRDEKGATQNGNGSTKPLFEVKSLPGQSTLVIQDLKLSPELTERLLAMKNKGINVDELLTKLLDRRDKEIVEEKVAIAKDLTETDSHYVPVRTKKVLREEHGTKCSIPTCKKPAEQIHHTQTFALSRMHDPHYLAPFCKDHHLLAHSINLKVHDQRAKALR